VAVALALAALGWPLGELTRSVPTAMVGGLLGTGLAVAWRARRDRERWPEQWAADRALREHTDPGPQYRAAVDEAARTQRARPAGLVLAGVVLVGLVVAACAWTAVERRDPTVAIAALPLVAAFAWGVLLQRRRDARADRWLADPPYPREEEQP
jgi:hypothetical protein